MDAGRLRPELERTVREAEKLEHSADRVESAPTQQKGKGIDPKNWGALGVSDDELDVDAQRAALDSWNVARRIANEGKDNDPGDKFRK